MEGKTVEQLREDFKKENDSRKRKLEIYKEDYKAEIYRNASIVGKIKITIRTWFENK